MGAQARKSAEATRAAIVQRVDQTMADAHAAATFQEALHVLARQSRLMIGAHQSAISYIPGGDFSRAIHTHSFSEKYAKYNTYDCMPTGKGIWGVIVEQCCPMRMTQEELISHARWKNFSDLKDARGLEHPPMRGWVAVPIVRQSGAFIGVLQLSDKVEGDFTQEDQDQLRHMATLIMPTFELQFVNQELQQRTVELEENNKELERFNRVAVDRELRMFELKKQINQLSREMNRPEPFHVT